MLLLRKSFCCTTLLVPEQGQDRTRGEMKGRVCMVLATAARQATEAEEPDEVRSMRKNR